MNYKVTSKTTKDEAARLLGMNIQPILDHGDKSLSDRVAYTSQHLADAKRKDVIDLLKDVMNALKDKFVVPAAADEGQPVQMVPQKSSVTAENLVKPTAKGAKKTSAAKTETAESGEKSETKAEKKSGAKKPSDKKGAVTALEGAENNPKTVQLAKMFPETIEVGGLEFKIHHNVTLDVLADDKLEFELAFYWTKRHLKQFPYFSDLLGHPKSFPNDLDTAQLVWVDDGDKEGKNKRVAYAVSDYTRAVYTILPDFLEEIDGLCCGAGIEFQVYSRPADTEPTTSEAEDEAETDEEETEE